MGMSAITFYGGVAGADEFEQRLRTAVVGISIGGHAVGGPARHGDVKRVAFLSPYFPAANTDVRGYLENRVSRSPRRLP